MTQRNKIILSSVAGGLLILGSIAYYNYRKLMDYVISLRSFKVRALSKNLVIVDLYLNFLNKSSLYFHVVSQTYNVFINDKKIITAQNNSSIPIVQGNNAVPIRVSFNPSKSFKDIGKSMGLLDVISSPNTKIRFDIMLNIKFWKVIPISIPYTYNTTFAQLFTKKE